jgi:hypothetical protein
MGKTFFAEVKDEKHRIVIPRAAWDDLKLRKGLWIRVTIEVMEEGK